MACFAQDRHAYEHKYAWLAAARPADTLSSRGLQASLHRQISISMEVLLKQHSMLSHYTNAGLLGKAVRLQA